jgi:uncharacterized protein (TIGR03067 family)
MKLRLFAAVAVLLVAAEAPGDEATEWKRLEGTWRLSYAEVNGRVIDKEDLPPLRLVVAGEKMTFLIEDRDLGLGTFRLSPGYSPKLIDQTRAVRGETGPRARVEILEGIYRLEKDRLTICLQGRARAVKERPTEFATQSGSGLRLQVFECEKP